MRTRVLCQGPDGSGAEEGSWTDAGGPAWNHPGGPWGLRLQEAAGWELESRHPAETMGTPPPHGGAFGLCTPTLKAPRPGRSRVPRRRLWRSPVAQMLICEARGPRPSRSPEALCPWSVAPPWDLAPVTPMLPSTPRAVLPTRLPVHAVSLPGPHSMSLTAPEGSAQTGPWLPGQSNPRSQETPLWSAGAEARGPEALRPWEADGGQSPACLEVGGSLLSGESGPPPT